MPLVRYEVRCEHSLATSELYHIENEDDSKRLLEGVAMAGLVGIIRQLGDLAEFGAEIFLGLHDDVRAIMSRSKNLEARVTRLEADLPSIEKALRSEACQFRFAYTARSRWRASLPVDQSACLQEKTPRFVQNFYEDCHEPPHLHLLDRFEPGGHGTCLKKYSDPTFFQFAWAASQSEKAEQMQRDWEAQEAKKKQIQLGSSFKRSGSNLSSREQTLSARSLNLEDSELSSPLIIEHRSKRLDQVPEIPASGDGTPEGAQSPDTSLKRPQLPQISQAPDEIAQPLKLGADDIKLSPQQQPSIDDHDDNNNKRRSGDEGGEKVVVESHNTNLESGEKNTSSQQHHAGEDNFIDPESKADDVEMHNNNSQTACPTPKIVDEDELEEVDEEEEEEDDDLLQMPELIVTEEEIDDAHKNLAVACNLPEVETPPVTTLHSGDMEKPFNETTTDCSRSAQQASNLPTQNPTQEEAVPESVETETGSGRTTDDSLIPSSSSTNVLESPPPPPLSSRIGDDVEPTTTSHENIHRGAEVKNSTVLIVGEYSTYCSSSTLSSPDMHMLSSALHEDDELEELYASSTSSSPRYKTFCAIFSPPDSPPPRIPPHELFMGAPSLYYTSQTQQTQHPTHQTHQNQFFGSGGGEESSSNFYPPGVPVLSLSPSVVSTNPSRQACAHLSEESKLLPAIPVSTDLAVQSSSSSPIASDDDCTPEMSLQHNLDTPEDEDEDAPVNDPPNTFDDRQSPPVTT